jgi:hypothetical protein
MSTGTSTKVTALLRAISEHVLAKEALNECKARLHETEEYFVKMGREITGIEEKTKFKPLGSRDEFEKAIRKAHLQSRAEARARPKNLPDWF